MAATGGTPLTAAHGMIDRVRRDTAVVRTTPHPTLAASLANRHTVVLDVADLADRRAAVDMHAPNLTRGQTQLGPVALFGHQLRATARRPSQLRTAMDLELDVVNQRSERNRPQRQSI